LIFTDNRAKWRKRKRESRINQRQQKLQEEEEEDDEENPNADEDHDRDYDSDDQHHPNSQPQQEIEVLSDHAVQISQFPMVIKRAVNRPHSSVTAIVALERAMELGDSKAQLQNPPFLENVSHGQLQALSAVPSDSLALDQDRAESSYVITPPPILEGRGVVKRFGSRVLVLPMHSGSLYFYFHFVAWFYL